MIKMSVDQYIESGLDCDQLLDLIQRGQIETASAEEIVSEVFGCDMEDFEDFCKSSLED